MVGFFLAFLCTIPLMFIHITKTYSPHYSISVFKLTHISRHLFILKSVTIALAGLGIVYWTTIANGGVSAGTIVEPSARTSTAVFALGSHRTI